MKLEQQAIDGEKAAKLLNDETLTALFDRVEESYIQEWQGTKVDDVDGREQLFTALRCLGHVRAHLRIMADHGQLAVVHLQKLKRKKMSKRS